MSPILARTDWWSLAARDRADWLEALRPAPPDADVAAIVADGRTRGDAALRELTARYDGADLPTPWLGADAIEAASVDPALEAALGAAARAIRRYHADQRDALRQERRVRTAPGVTAWRRWRLPPWLPLASTYTWAGTLGTQPTKSTKGCWMSCEWLTKC